MILDDSASALDFATDARLRSAIKNLPYGQTVFIVSQRASSIRHADKIIVLDDGCAVGIGSHEELLESCGCIGKSASPRWRKEERAHEREGTERHFKKSAALY